MSFKKLKLKLTYGLKIQNTLRNAFGVRCPNSMSSSGVTGVFFANDFESECAWSNRPVNETAFCGNCARTNQNSLFYNVNASMSFSYVS